MQIANEKQHFLIQNTKTHLRPSFQVFRFWRADRSWDSVFRFQKYADRFSSDPFFVFCTCFVFFFFLSSSHISYFLLIFLFFFRRRKESFFPATGYLCRRRKKILKAIHLRNLFSQFGSSIEHNSIFDGLVELEITWQGKQLTGAF